MKRNIYIVPAEGGKDSELFANDLCKAFVKLATNMKWSVD